MVSGYRNALPLLSEEDVLGACFIYVKLEKHSVDQLRRWLACRGIKNSWNKTALLKRNHYEVTNTAPFAGTPDADTDSAMPKLS